MDKPSVVLYMHAISWKRLSSGDEGVAHNKKIIHKHSHRSDVSGTHLVSGSVFLCVTLGFQFTSGSRVVWCIMEDLVSYDSFLDVEILVAHNSHHDSLARDKCFLYYG